MNAFQAIILGIVQGLTEFLPISSTAHLRIIPALLHWDDPGTAFSAFIQLGTVFAVIIYFWKDVTRIYLSLFSELFMWITGKSSKLLSSFNSKIALWVLLGTIPICVFGLILKKPLESGLLRGLNTIGFSLIFFGVLLYISELCGKQIKILKDITIVDVFLIGFSQSLALIPGVSRSGVTLLTALFLGLKRYEAARFSFLLSIPAVILSGILETYTLITYISNSGEKLPWINLVVGVLFAFISGYIAIDFLLKYLQNHRTTLFVVYRVLLGAFIIYLSCASVIR